jgi:23S rRNA (guanosine2251-2'-O)-methyltransferase
MGTAMEGSIEYTEADYKGPLAIVIGSEGEGMRDMVRKECDFLVRIPMSGKVNSLNAAVAAGIVIFEAVKSRK